MKWSVKLFLLLPLAIAACSTGAKPEEAAAPTEASSSMENGMVEISASQVFLIKFVKPIDCSTVTSSTLFILALPPSTAVETTDFNADVCDPAHALPAEVSCPTNIEAILKPLDPLEIGTTYALCVSPDIIHEDGTHYAGQMVVFAAVDTTPPLVIESYPSEGSADIPVNAVVRATFSEEMELDEFTPESFTLRFNKEPVEGGISYDTSKTAVFTPSKKLESFTTYTATLSRNLADPAGNALGIDFVWQFTTSDIIGPSVIMVSPTAGAVDIDEGSAVTVFFSEDMDAFTITAQAFQVLADDKPVAGVVAYDAPGRKATFSPKGPLAYDTKYTARLLTDARDAAGNPLNAPASWTFTTRSAPTWMWVERNEGLSGIDEISGMAIDPAKPETIYALTGMHGVYKSEDGGATWAVRNYGIPTRDKWVQWGHLDGNLLTMDPNNPLILYTNISGQPYKTTDGGEKWENINHNIDVCSKVGAGYQVAGIVVDPSNSEHIIAGYIAGGCDGGLHESIDSGETTGTWLSINRSTEDPKLWGIGNDTWPLAIAIDPEGHKHMYTTAMTDGIGFAYSTDGGKSWTRNPPPEMKGSNGYGLAVHPAKTNRVFVGGKNGLYRNENYGEDKEWVAAAGVTSAIRDIKFAPSDSQIGYAVGDNGIYRTGDGGLNWTPLGHDDIYPKSVFIHPTNPDIIYLGTKGLGVYKSTDGGIDIVAINNGLPKTFSARVLNVEGGVYFIGISGRGVYKSTDRGKSWSFVLPMKSAQVVEVDPNDPNVLYVGGYSPSGIFKSIDGGKNWKQVYKKSASSLYVDPRNSDNIIGLCYDSESNKYAVCRSGKGGEKDTWSSEIPDIFRKTFAIMGFLFDDSSLFDDNADNDHLYIYGLGLGKFFWSQDDGKKWEECAGLPQCDACKPDCECQWVDAGANAPSSPNIVYIATRDRRIYRLERSEGKISWDNIPQLPSGNQAFVLAVDVKDPNILYTTSLSDKELYRYRHADRKWEALSTAGAPASFQVYSIKQDPLAPNRLIVGTQYDGVYTYEVGRR